MGERRLEYMRLDEIKRADSNPKLHVIQDIKRSIRELGFGEAPLLNEKTGKLLAGHGRLEATQELHADGAKVPDGITVAEDGMWLIPVTRGISLNKQQANAYLIASNSLTTKGGWDDRGLLDALQDLDSSNFLQLTGFSGDQLDDLIAKFEELPLDDYDDREGLRRQKNRDELADEYDERPVRLLVLNVPISQYPWLVDRMEALRDQFEVEGNQDVVMRLVAEATGSAIPA